MTEDLTNYDYVTLRRVGSGWVITIGGEQALTKDVDVSHQTSDAVDRLRLIAFGIAHDGEDSNQKPVVIE